MCGFSPITQPTTPHKICMAGFGLVGHGMSRWRTVHVFLTVERNNSTIPSCRETLCALFYSMARKNKYARSRRETFYVLSRPGMGKAHCTVCTVVYRREVSHPPSRPAPFSQLNCPWVTVDSRPFFKCFRANRVKHVPSRPVEHISSHKKLDYSQKCRKYVNSEVHRLIG